MHTIKQERIFRLGSSHSELTNNWEVGYLSYVQDSDGGSENFIPIIKLSNRIAAMRFASFMNGSPSNLPDLEAFLSKYEVER